jgi:ribosome modulation factor
VDKYAEWSGLSLEELKQKAWDAGHAAKCYAECPFISGQRVLNYWVNGFVAHCVETGNIPSDTPLYVIGRIAYLRGTPCSGMPDGELASGEWFRGWRVQQDITPEQPNKSEVDPDSLLDLVFL